MFYNERRELLLLYVLLLQKNINFLFQHLLIFIFRMFTLSFCTYKVIIYATCPMLLFPNFVFFFLFQKDLFVYVGISNYHRNNSCSKRNCKTILYNSFCVFVIGHNQKLIKSMEELKPPFVLFSFCTVYECRQRDQEV